MHNEKRFFSIGSSPLAAISCGEKRQPEAFDLEFQRKSSQIIDLMPLAYCPACYLIYELHQKVSFTLVN
jgi:hypothetical protein